MADLNRLKKVSSSKATLGAPPSPDEASTNLQAPETAPASEPSASEAPAPPPKTFASPPVPQSVPQPRIDGRALRRSRRTVPFATRVTAEFDLAIRQIAEERGLKIVEILEAALAAYQKDSS